MGWDVHGTNPSDDLMTQLPAKCREMDRPVTALLLDLKRRGLLETTLVIWGGEFGRTPMSQGKTGRDHSPFGFSIWMAGAGIQGGRMIGATDEIGLRAVQKPYHVRDLHATILHQLGLDHEQLTYHYGGRDFRATDVYGEIVKGIIA